MPVTRTVCFLPIFIIGMFTLKSVQAAQPQNNTRVHPEILSASWGTDNGVSCPSGETNLDNLPVTFNWFIRKQSIQLTDFTIVRDDGTTVHPTCALQFPPNESNERQTVNLIGDFGDHVAGPLPVNVLITGQLQGKPPTSLSWRRLRGGLGKPVQQLQTGPAIVDAWIIPQSLYRGDKNRCQAGSTFLRVMWSNGLTAYPSGEEVGDAVRASYRAVFSLIDGHSFEAEPLEIADLYDHQTPANADNMHDLCLQGIPKGARLRKVQIDADLIQDPNGDPNPAQSFQVP